MCELTVPISYAGRDRHRRRGEPACDECREAGNAKHREWQKTRSYRTIRAAHLWANYRLRYHEYQAILEQQNYCCGICDSPLPENDRNVHVDHSHFCEHDGRGYYSCGSCVRGVLCQRCNTSLAILEDDEWLKRALNYLGNENVAEVLSRTRLWSGGDV